jgi:hypothetical protein
MTIDRIARTSAVVTFWAALTAAIASAATVFLTGALALLLFTALSLATAGYARQVMTERGGRRRTHQPILS